MSKWTDEELVELEDPDQLDWDNAEWRPGNPNAGAVLSVRFTTAELTRVEMAAEAAGLSLFQFIHDTVLARAAQPTVDSESTPRPQAVES